jgi:hypothetical protein
MTPKINNRLTSGMLAGLLMILLLTSCLDKERKGLKPMVAGRPGEVLLVIDPYLWESSIGEYFTRLFSEPFEGLPADEPIYDLIHIPSSSFNKIFKSHRNIFLVKIGSEFKEPKIIVQRDIWAYPQLVVNLIGPSDTSLVRYLRQSQEKLLTLLKVDERNRIIMNYSKNLAKGVDVKLRQEHGVSISVPAGYEMDVDSANFVWLSHETAEISQGILIYFYPYTDPNTFTPEYLVKKRDEFTRRYVPGPKEGSYMITEKDYPVIFRELEENNRYIAELKGLWKLQNGFMGGPFVSHTMLDEKNNRVVTADGFVYAPGQNKRNYVRELEAILQTFKVVE